jgi:hypothetical protein
MPTLASDTPEPSDLLELAHAAAPGQDPDQDDIHADGVLSFILTTPFVTFHETMCMRSAFGCRLLEQRQRRGTVFASGAAAPTMSTAEPDRPRGAGR